MMILGLKANRSNSLRNHHIYVTKLYPFDQQRALSKDGFDFFLDEAPGHEKWNELPEVCAPVCGAGSSQKRGTPLKTMGVVVYLSIVLGLFAK